MNKRKRTAERIDVVLQVDHPSCRHCRHRHPDGPYHSDLHHRPKPAAAGGVVDDIAAAVDVDVAVAVAVAVAVEDGEHPL